MYVIIKSGAFVIQEGSAHTRTRNLKKHLAQNRAKLIIMINMRKLVNMCSPKRFPIIQKKDPNLLAEKTVSNLWQSPMQKSMRMCLMKKFPDKFLYL